MMIPAPTLRFTARPPHQGSLPRDSTPSLPKRQLDRPRQRPARLPAVPRFSRRTPPEPNLPLPLIASLSPLSLYYRKNG